MRIAMQHNFQPAVLTISSIIMALHYKILTNCPIVVACGPSETGKTTTMKIALSFIGERNYTFYSHVQVTCMHPLPLDTCNYLVA